MKLIFLGTPEFAIPSLEELLKTNWVEILAVCTQTDKASGRGKHIHMPPVKKIALKNNLMIIQTEKIAQDREAIDKIKSLNPEIIISCAFGEFLNNEILNVAPFGAINVHPSLLPKYRGASPINWAILNGEKETGITIMKTILEMDAGPIILQEKINIEENETSVELGKKLSLISAKLLIKALEQIKNKKAKYIPQDNSRTTKAPALTKELGLINWNEPSKNIHNKIRGLQPWPGAYTHYDGKMIKVWESRNVACNVSTNDSQFSSGTIVELNDYIRVKTSDGYLDLYKLQEENKKILNVKDWINGARVKVGDRFE